MKLPVILVFIWLVFKAMMLQLGYASERIGVILNVFFLVLIIFITVRSLGGDRAFFPMLKAGMRPAAIYIMLVCIGIFIYYQWMDPGYMPGIIESNMQAIENAIETEGGFEEFSKDRGPMMEENREEYLQEQREGFEMIFSPFARVSQSLLGLTILALVYCLMMIGVYKVAKRFIKE